MANDAIEHDAANPVEEKNQTTIDQDQAIVDQEAVDQAAVVNESLDLNDPEDQPSKDWAAETSDRLSDDSDESSALYVGRWRGLVSTTNWEKGKVIVEWRQSLIAQGAEVGEYSDDAWSRRVGRITPQHVGRLRRVYDVFGASRTSFEGLFWSHFHAAIDWDDAEMWLEGAVQNGWSVSQMRRQRWETLGSVAADEPQDADVVSTEDDEDIDYSESEPLTSHVDSSLETVEGFGREASTHEPTDQHDADDANEGSSGPGGSGDDGLHCAADVGESTEAPVELVRPFENLPTLPDDLADAFDEMKLAILRHKVNGWEEISMDDVLRSLDALKQLAAAPSDLAV